MHKEGKPPMRLHKEKAAPARQEHEVQETQEEVPVQETPAADAAEGTVAEIDAALTENAEAAAAKEKAARQELEALTTASFHDMIPTMADFEAAVTAWEQKYAQDGFYVEWCCGVPHFRKR